MRRAVAFDDRFAAYRLQFEGWLAEELRSWNLQRELKEPCEYMLSSPGKRVRPVLVLAAADLCGIPLKLCRSFALAVEALHTASLIHDDLPALDNDDLRRGRPTCHRVYGEARAVLAGDVLIAYAIDLASTGGDGLPEVGLAHARLLSATTVSLCEGQALDLLPSEQRGGDILTVYRMKTGSLFQACFLAPVEFVPTGERAAIAEKLGRFADAFGTLFQVVDDILDHRLNEPTGENRVELNYVDLHGLAAAESLADNSLSEALAALESFGTRGEFLRELVVRMRSRES